MYPLDYDRVDLMDYGLCDAENSESQDWAAWIFRLGAWSSVEENDLATRTELKDSDADLSQ